MAARVPRTRAGNTWTEARFWGFIRSLLRQGWSRYPVKFQVQRAARRDYKGPGRNKYQYQCAACSGWHFGTNVQVDHINPAGELRCFADLPGFCERLFCEADNLQVLCKPCHQLKTTEERNERRSRKAVSGG